MIYEYHQNYLNILLTDAQSAMAYSAYYQSSGGENRLSLPALDGHKDKQREDVLHLKT